VEAAERVLTPAVQSVEITNYSGDSYQIRYRASSDSLIRIAVPYYPGWVATVDGSSVPLLVVDEALMGVFVPSGSHSLTLQFQPHWFGIGAGLSVACAVALVLGLVLG